MKKIFAICVGWIPAAVFIYVSESLSNSSTYDVFELDLVGVILVIVSVITAFSIMLVFVAGVLYHRLGFRSLKQYLLGAVMIFLFLLVVGEATDKLTFESVLRGAAAIFLNCMTFWFIVLREKPK